jgi:hypothetical protein
MTLKDLIAEFDSLGDILRIIVPTLEHEHVMTAARSQKPGERIGSVFLRMGLVTIADVDRALDLQHRLRETQDVEALNELLEAAKAEARQKIRTIQWALPPPTGVGGG